VINTILCWYLSIYKVFAIFLFIVNTHVFGQDFEKIFNPDFQTAIDIINDIKPKMENQIKNLGGDYKVCAAIVFPEIIRYSLLKDQMETAALKVFYTKLGNRYANFSIGLFQMKPSFVERLEKEIISFLELSEFHFISEYPFNISKENERNLRLKRLSDLDWQITYLVCFTRLIDNIHKNNYSELGVQNIKNRISLFATSYNTGFWYDTDKIFEYKTINLFPTGNNIANNQFNYHDISYYFYENYLNKIDFIPPSPAK